MDFIHGSLRAPGGGAVGGVQHSDVVDGRRWLHRGQGKVAPRLSSVKIIPDPPRLEAGSPVDLSCDMVRAVALVVSWGALWSCLVVP